MLTLLLLIVFVYILVFVGYNTHQTAATCAVTDGFSLTLGIVSLCCYFCYREREDLESSDESDTEMDTDARATKPKHDLMMKSEVRKTSKKTSGNVGLAAVTAAT